MQIKCEDSKVGKRIKISTTINEVNDNSQKYESELNRP